MARYYKLRIWIFMIYPLDGCAPVAQVGISNISQAIVIGAFYQASAVKNFLLIKPNNNVVLSVTLARVIGFKSMTTD